MAVKLITIKNRKNETFKVSDRKPLLQELRAKELIFLMDVSMEDV